MCNCCRLFLQWYDFLRTQDIPQRNHISDLQSCFYDQAMLDPWGCLEGQACVQNHFLPGRRTQQLSAGHPKEGSQHAELTGEQMTLVLGCSHLSWGSVSEAHRAVTGRDSSSYFSLCITEKCASLHRIAQISSILVPFWEKLGIC